MSEYVLAIDSGTTSTRALIFNRHGQVVASQSEEIEQYYPENGWVEHVPAEIWEKTLRVCQEAISSLNLTGADIQAIGITNQRETTVIWDRKTGEPIANAIVWQDRRTASRCEQLREQGLEEMVKLKTGLLIDPYFCATKIQWLLDNISGARERAEQGELAFGTIDSYLLWKLTGGKVHATDATNASRTILFNIHTQQWDDELLRYFAIPKALLPTVHDNCADFGATEAALFDSEIAIAAMIGDQQAALVGQACLEAGQIKSTYGTGCFMIANTGNKAVSSNHRLLTTIAYQVKGKTTYALEGSIFVAGAAVQWLRDALKLIHTAQESEEIATTVADTGGVYLVPAFTGLGAPYWDPLARGAILGLTRDSGVEHIVRAALESVCYQSADLLKTMEKDGLDFSQSLRVDGGMIVNDWLMQFLSDILNKRVERASLQDTTALGAAFLAGLQIGWYESLEAITELWQSDAIFSPTMSESKRNRLYQGWQEAVLRVESKGVEACV